VPQSRVCDVDLCQVPWTRCVLIFQREIRKRKANWIGHILRRNCLLNQVIEGQVKGEMEVTRRRGRKRKKLLHDRKDSRRYSHLKEEAVDRTMWMNRFGRDFGPAVRQNTEWMNENVNVNVYKYILTFCWICKKCILVWWTLRSEGTLSTCICNNCRCFLLGDSPESVVSANISEHTVCSIFIGE
jgi:hypothetical protein